MDLSGLVNFLAGVAAAIVGFPAFIAALLVQDANRSKPPSELLMNIATALFILPPLAILSLLLL